MIKSMTGFGKAVYELESKNIIVEARALNSKQLDLNVRVPHLYKEKELEIRNIISEKLIRGKIELVIYFEFKDNTLTKEINKSVVTQYYNQLKQISDEVNDSGSDLMGIVMRLPDVLKPEVDELKEDEWLKAKEVLEQAINALDEYRISEGTSLENDFTCRVNLINEYLGEIEKFEKARLEKIKLRIRQNLDEFLDKEKIDENRFEQELIFYIEKFDISEEKVRLTKHCEYFKETMLVDDAVGKKLNFISQEMGREINTIGSKSNDADMQRYVVLMKDELEKVKEQVLNAL